MMPGCCWPVICKLYHWVCIAQHFRSVFWSSSKQNLITAVVVSTCFSCYCCPHTGENVSSGYASAWHYLWVSCCYKLKVKHMKKGKKKKKKIEPRWYWHKIFDFFTFKNFSKIHFIGSYQCYKVSLSVVNIGHINSFVFQTKLKPKTFVHIQ